MALKFSSYVIITTFLLLSITIVTVCLVFTMKEKWDAEADTHILLEKQEWIHGAADCNTQSDAPIQVVQYNRNTWILRQNKCVHYEAPFMYLLLGENKALLIDTGATDDEAMFPLYETVTSLLNSQRNLSIIEPLPLIVAHSHSHSDHYAGDGQFRGKAGVQVVGLEVEDVKTFFNINQWPDGVASLDLGNRLVEIFAIPGHQPASIAVYDNASKLLITGDTFYPGRLYVFDWAAFKRSIQKLWTFAVQHEISYIVGTHIEMTSTPGIDYPVGSTYQPNEQKLPLTVEELGSLNDALQRTSDTPEHIVFEKFIVMPR